MAKYTRAQNVLDGERLLLNVYGRGEGPHKPIAVARWNLLPKDLEIYMWKHEELIDSIGIYLKTDTIYCRLSSTSSESTSSTAARSAKATRTSRSFLDDGRDLRYNLAVVH